MLAASLPLPLVGREANKGEGGSVMMVMKGSEKGGRDAGADAAGEERQA